MRTQNTNNMTKTKQIVKLKEINLRLKCFVGALIISLLVIIWMFPFVNVESQRIIQKQICEYDYLNITLDGKQVPIGYEFTCPGLKCPHNMEAEWKISCTKLKQIDENTYVKDITKG